MFANFKVYFFFLAGAFFFLSFISTRRLPERRRSHGPKEEIEKKAVEISKSPFTPELAEKLLKASASSASQWFIPPLQDFLYMDKKLWLEKASDERINIPGTVTQFNWTYRLPCTVEELCSNNDLIEKIKRI